VLCHGSGPSAAPDVEEDDQQNEDLERFYASELITLLSQPNTPKLSSTVRIDRGPSAGQLVFFHPRFVELVSQPLCSLQEKSKYLREVMRYMLFRQQEKPNVPVPRCARNHFVLGPLLALYTALPMEPQQKR
jgi:hypothetical protein